MDVQPKAAASHSAAQNRAQIDASIGLVIGGMMWGLFWIPVHAIADLGLPGAWAGVVIYIAATILLLPLVWKNRVSMMTRWRELAICGLFTGAAFSFYTTSLSLTDVVRALLLFYLTPVWGTILGLMILGERPSGARALALLMGIGGLLVVLGLGDGLPWPRNIGDWLALASGFSWAYGSMKLFQMGKVPVSQQVIAFLIGGLLATIATLILGVGTLTPVVELSTLIKAAPLAIACAIFALPMIFLTIWPATLLSPGRAGLLLMSEALVGVASAAIWSGEPFGAREMLGTAMIVGAAFVEVLGTRAATKKPR